MTFSKRTARSCGARRSGRSPRRRRSRRVGSGPRCATAARPCSGRTPIRSSWTGVWAWTSFLGDREAAFFLETTGVSGDCGTADEFAAHVDAGAFVLKSGSWAEVLLRQQLALSIFDNDFLEHSPCSTRGWTR